MLLLLPWLLSVTTVQADTGQSLRLRSGQACPQIVINEVVTDPQQDWDDSAGGDGIPFDDSAGAGSITSSDEWTELLNVSDRVLNLIDWRLVMTDTTPATQVLGQGSATLRFSAGGSLSYFQPGERLVIGNPAGSMNNDVYLQLLDAAGNVVDDVEIGDDFENDGADGAPLPGESGNADDINDEAIARAPDGIDTNDDVADFTRQRATLGRSNGRGSLSVALPALNSLGSDEGACDAFITVQNVGITTTKAILLTWDTPGTCPPNCDGGTRGQGDRETSGMPVPSEAEGSILEHSGGTEDLQANSLLVTPSPPLLVTEAGPARVECSGLIQPGAAWTFRPPSGGTAPRRGAGGQVNPVGLAAVIVERSRTGTFDTPGDDSAGSVAIPLTTAPFSSEDLAPPECP